MAALPIMMGASLLSSVLGGVLGGKAATEQAAGAMNAANAANSIQYGQQQLTRSDLAPYTSLGTGAATTLQNLLGVGAPPGSGPSTPATLSPDIQSKQGLLTFLQDWMNGKNPTQMNGQPIGPAPSNAATRAKVQGQIDQLQRDIQTGQEMVDNTNKQQALNSQQDPSKFGSLMKNFTLADFTADPGYNFRLSEGAKALERSAAAKGGLFSGGTLKDLTQYNQNFASNEFSNSYNRFQQNRATQFNQLAGAAGIGQVSAGQVANLGQNTANNMANNTEQGITGAANAQAAGTTNLANSINSGINNAISIYANRNMITNGGSGTLGYPAGYPSGSSTGGYGTGGYPGTPPFVPSGSLKQPTNLRLN